MMEETITKEEMLSVLKIAKQVIDELFPGAKHIACNVGLLNDGCIEINRAIALAEGEIENAGTTLQKGGGSDVV